MTSKFIFEGPIPLDTLQKISSARTRFDIGSEAFFLGIIRADKSENQKVVGIDYTAYTPMANKVFQEIQDDILQQYGILKLVILHSVGMVKIGEASMLVYVQSKHRKAAFEALEQTVELIKEKAPVWKQEFYEDDSYLWVNVEKDERL
ncbi:MAG: molybdenum cofactor biosynthesis protein MoaE [Chitinophagales bacterium]